MVVDVDQPWGEDVPRAVDNSRVVSGQLTPSAAGTGGDDTTISESDECVGEVDTRADQPD